MKVVFFSSTGCMVGGAVMCLKEILLYCIKNGIEPFVILRSHGDLEQYLEQIGVRYDVVGYHDWLRPKKDHGGLKNELKWRIKDVQNRFAEEKAYNILKRERPDVYHINVIYNPCGAVSAHRLGIPVVWHLREFTEINDDTPFFRDRVSAYKLISESEKVLCVSDCIKEYYSQFIPSDKMLRIYDGIPILSDPITVRQKNDVIHITLSGGARVKGHRDLIEAARIMVSRGYSAFSIDIAGRFFDESYLTYLKQKVIEYGLEEKISFLGFQTDMDALWRKTDIAVVCSRFESFGLSVCEAMSRAIPVVCAKSTGTYEITNHGEYAKLYDVGSYEQLADKLIETIEDYDSAAKNAMCIASKIREMYSIDDSCQGLIGVFHDVTGKK